jgi:hypothetical protein
MMSEVFWAFAALEIVKAKTAMIRVFIYRAFMPVPPENVLTGASSNSTIEQRVADFSTPLTYETPLGRLATSNEMKIASFIRHLRFRLKRLREKNAESFHSQQWSESTKG